MEIITLVENSCGDTECIAEHGLCVYIKTEKHCLLMDTGQTDAVLHNADLLGIDLSAIDTIILSHGHYDHSGGILPLMKRCPHAAVYMQESAAEPHFNGDRYIGIDKNIPALPNVHRINGNLRIDDELFLFSGISGRRCFPQGNLRLLQVQNGVTLPDDFRHEQCLVVSQNQHHWLLSGCAHNGILNILDEYHRLFGSDPDYVISGFHMMKKNSPYTPEEIKTIRQTAEELTMMKTIFYSGHCTGENAFALMKEIMDNRLLALHSGNRII